MVSWTESDDGLSFLRVLTRPTCGVQQLARSRDLAANTVLMLLSMTRMMLSLTKAGKSPSSSSSTLRQLHSPLSFLISLQSSNCQDCLNVLWWIV